MQVSKEKLVEELDNFFNLLFKLYSLERNRGRNRARALALAYAEALRRAGINNARVMLAEFNTGTPITNIKDTTILKYFTELAISMKYKLAEFNSIDVLIDDEKYLIKILTH